uniref:Putative secreted protein n=1 Tax=Anopheles darlingi TaxID=43151 RepID=A0A2M4DBZ1_ANODA
MSRYCSMVTFTVIASMSILRSEAGAAAAPPPAPPTLPPSVERFEMMCRSTSSSGRSSNANRLRRTISKMEAFSSCSISPPKVLPPSSSTPCGSSIGSDDGGLRFRRNL